MNNGINNCDKIDLGFVHKRNAVSVSPDWGKIRLIRVVGAMEKANPNIAPGYAKLRSMNIAGTWMTAIATNVGIIHADISSEWKKNISMSIR